MRLARTGPRRLATRGLAIAGVAIAALFMTDISASAAEPTTLVYSTDNGATWSTSLPSTAGQTVLVRAYYDNSTSSDVLTTSVSTTLPAGYSLVPGSTRTCLNPGTTDPTAPSAELVCNTDSGMGGAINESAVWSGGTLTIAPNAGLYGESTSATSGLMAAGRVRYLNLQECSYYNAPATAPFNIVVPVPNQSGAFTTGTTVSNTADTTPDCGSGNANYAYQPVNSASQPLDLLGRRYVNLQECSYYNAPATAPFNIAVSVPNQSGDFTTGTGTSNTADATPDCGSGNANYAYQPVNSASLPLDTIGNRYLNLQECSYYNAPATAPFNIWESVPNSSGAFTTGTGMSNTPDTSVDCGGGNANYAYQPVNSASLPLDLRDTTRGQGYVEFAMVVPNAVPLAYWPVALGVVVLGSGAWLLRRRNATGAA